MTDIAKTTITNVAENLETLLVRILSHSSLSNESWRRYFDLYTWYRFYANKENLFDKAALIFSASTSMTQDMSDDPFGVIRSSFVIRELLSQEEKEKIKDIIISIIKVNKEEHYNIALETINNIRYVKNKNNDSKNS